MTWQAWWLWAMFSALFIKTISVGSEFNFHQWAKYGRAYTKWYFDREDWKHYLMYHPTLTRKEAKRKAYALLAALKEETK